MELSTFMYIVGTLALIAKLMSYCEASIVSILLVFFIATGYENIMNKIDDLQIEDSMADAIENKITPKLEELIDGRDALLKGVNLIYYDTQDIGGISDKLDEVKEDTQALKDKFNIY